MDLHEYAAREVSALLDRVVSEAEKRAHTLIDVSRREHDHALATLRSQLAAQDLALKAHVHEKEQFAVSAAEMHSQLEDLRRDFEAQRDELRTISRDAELQRSLAVANMSASQELMEARAALEDSQTEAQRLTRQLEAQRDELRTIGRDAELQRSLAVANMSASQELMEARAALEDSQAEAQRLTRQLEAQRDELRTMSRDAELQRGLAVANISASQELIEARAALEDSQAVAQRLTRQFDSALDDLRNEHVATLQQQAVARTALPLDELLTMFQSLATASSPSAVLTTIVSGLGREFSRVALFRARASRLECVKHVGFDFEGDVSKVMIPISLDCLLTRAVASKRTETFVTGSSQGPCAVPFGGTPSCAVALPLISGDASVAVIYADDSDLLEFGAVPAELLVKFADLVWQHAVLVLQRMSAAQKMLAVAPPRHDVERLA